MILTKCLQCSEEMSAAGALYSALIVVGSGTILVPRGEG